MSTIDIDELSEDLDDTTVDDSAGNLDFGDEFDEDFFGLGGSGDEAVTPDDQAAFDADDFSVADDLDDTAEDSALEIDNGTGNDDDADEDGTEDELDADAADEDSTADAGVAFFDFDAVEAAEAAEAAETAEADDDEGDEVLEDVDEASEDTEDELLDELSDDEGDDEGEDDAAVDDTTDELDSVDEAALEEDDTDDAATEDDDTLDLTADPAEASDDDVEVAADEVDDSETDTVDDADTDTDNDNDEHVWVGASKYDADADTDPTDGIWDVDSAHADDELDDADAEDDEPMPLPKRARVSVPLEDEAAELERIIEDELLTMVYQPITSLMDDSVVGYEALARGPEDSPLATPAAMFTAAENHDRLHELDLLCQTQAVLQARDVLLQSGHALFVNVEPSVIADAAFGRDEGAVEKLSALLSNMTASCPVVLEISDRYPYESAAEMLAIVMWARSHGFRIALDDVSVSPHSLALLPLLEPDVIKLNRWVLQAKPDADLGLLMNVIRVQAERTGAAIVAQGIESPEDRELALAMGATHVQGFGVGLPAELSEAPVRIRSLEPVRASYAESAVSAFDLVAGSMSRRTGTAGVVEALALDLERQADQHSDAVILTNFEAGELDLADIKERYENMAKTSQFVVALAEGLEDLNEVYTGCAEPTDPAYNERSVVVLTPHFAAALLARRTGDVGATDEFTFTVTYDRGLVTRAARLLITHLDI